MHGFEDVTLSWQGAQYVVPANRQLMLIAKIEDALSAEGTEQAISVLFRREGPPHSRLAGAFGAALRFAGAKVTDEDIYLAIQSDIAQKSPADVALALQVMVFSVISIISPPAARMISGEADAAEGLSEKKA